jgi:hypothetical protein
MKHELKQSLFNSKKVTVFYTKGQFEILNTDAVILILKQYVCPRSEFEFQNTLGNENTKFSETFNDAYTITVDNFVYFSRPFVKCTKTFEMVLSFLTSMTNPKYILSFKPTSGSGETSLKNLYLDRMPHGVGMIIFNNMDNDVVSRIKDIKTLIKEISKKVEKPYHFYRLRYETNKKLTFNFKGESSNSKPKQLKFMENTGEQEEDSNDYETDHHLAAAKRPMQVKTKLTEIDNLEHV